MRSVAPGVVISALTALNPVPVPVYVLASGFDLPLVPLLLLCRVLVLPLRLALLHHHLLLFLFLGDLGWVSGPQDLVLVASQGAVSGPHLVDHPLPSFGGAVVAVVLLVLAPDTRP